MVRAIAICLLLSGCSWFGGTIKEPVLLLEKTPIVCTAVKPKAIRPLDVTLEVIQDKEGIWWVALNDQAYKNVAINNKEVNRYIKDLQLYADTLNDCIFRNENL